MSSSTNHCCMSFYLSFEVFHCKQHSTDRHGITNRSGGILRLEGGYGELGSDFQLCGHCQSVTTAKNHESDIMKIAIHNAYELRDFERKLFAQIWLATCSFTHCC